MNRDNENFSKLMAKYKLSEPLSLDDQHYIINSRKSNLKKLLKKTGKYSFILWFLSLVGILFRNIGLKLTFLQTKIAAAIVAMIIPAASVTGGYYTVLYVKEKVVEKKSDEKHEEKTDININAVKDKEKENFIELKKRIGSQVKRDIIIKSETAAEKSRENNTRPDEDVKKDGEKSSIKTNQNKRGKTESLIDIPSL